jgi:hypothetical protein
MKIFLSLLLMVPCVIFANNQKDSDAVAFMKYHCGQKHDPNDIASCLKTIKKQQQAEAIVSSALKYRAKS